MLARNSETFGKVPRWSVKLCLYFPPTYFYPGASSCLSPLQLVDGLNLGHGLRLAEVCCKSTIPCGGGTSWYLSQSCILDFSLTPFHPPTWMRCPSQCLAFQAPALQTMMVMIANISYSLATLSSTLQIPDDFTFTILLLSPFHRWRKQGLERSHDLAKVTQQVSHT